MRMVVKDGRGVARLSLMLELGTIVGRKCKLHRQNYDKEWCKCVMVVGAYYLRVGKPHQTLNTLLYSLCSTDFIL